jgi:acyl-homoserine-lactone acylase
VRDPGFDWTKPVDGSIKATELEDRRWRPGADEYGFPIIINPECGFIQTANDPPWAATVPSLARSDYPEYVYPPGWRELGTRGATQRALLAARDDLGHADLEGLLFDCFVPSAYHGVRALRAAFLDGAGAIALSPRARELDELLAGWDGRATTDSAAMTVAFYLNRALPGGIPACVVVQTDDPVTQPEIRAPQLPTATGAEYALSLEIVGEALQSLYGTLHKPWGEIHVIDRPGGALGVPGGCNDLRALFGTWRGWWDVGDDLGSDGIERCNFGSRTLRLTRIAADGVATFSVAITGQVPANEHPGSPHHRDQSDLYAQRRLKKLPLTPSEYEAEARSADHQRCNHQAVEHVSWESSPASDVPAGVEGIAP